MALAERIQNIDNKNKSTQSVSQIRKCRTQKKGRLWIPVVGVVLGLAVGNIIIQGLVVNKNYQIRNLQSRIQEKEREMLKLRIEIANLESFDRVREIAQNELGMKAAGPEDYLIIPAVPVEQNGLTRPSKYIAAATDRNVFDKIASWLGGVGKTMANTP
jgi:cell division protein FtsL